METKPRAVASAWKRWLQTTTLPSPTDHAFADGGAWPIVGTESGLPETLLGKVVRLIHTVYYRQLGKAAAAQFLNGAVLGHGVRISHTARLINRAGRESVRIGSHCIIRGIIRNEGRGSVMIGDEVYLGDNTLLSAAQQITIGSQTLVAHGVQVFDNASHPFDNEERARHFQMMLGLAPKQAIAIPSSPVTIGNNCWICMNSIILQGAQIGDRSIISAGSVVRGEVPAGVVYTVENGSVVLTPIRKSPLLPTAVGVP